MLVTQLKHFDTAPTQAHTHAPALTMTLPRSITIAFATYGKMSVNLRIFLTVYSPHETRLVAFPARAKHSLGGTSVAKYINPSTPTVAIWVHAAMKHMQTGLSRTSFVIFDIRAL